MINKIIIRIIIGFVAFFLVYFIYYMLKFIGAPANEKEHFTILEALWSAGGISIMKAILSLLFSLPFLLAIRFFVQEKFPVFKLSSICILFYISFIIAQLWMGAGKTMVETLSDENYWYFTLKYIIITFSSIIVYVIILLLSKRFFTANNKYS